MCFSHFKYINITFFKTLSYSKERFNRNIKSIQIKKNIGVHVCW